MKPPSNRTIVVARMAALPFYLVLISIAQGAEPAKPEGQQKPLNWYSAQKLEAGAKVPPLPGGGFAWLQVRAWDTRLGETYEDVASLGRGGYGESSLFRAQGGDPTVIEPTPPQPLLGLQSFSLQPVPEPSTWALVALGGLSVFWAVRHQRRGD